jgi:hypothetical protein
MEREENENSIMSTEKFFEDNSHQKWQPLSSHTKVHVILSLIKDDTIMRMAAGLFTIARYIQTLST